MTQSYPIVDDPLITGKAELAVSAAADKATNPPMLDGSQTHRFSWTGFLLQIGHRAASLSLFLLIAVSVGIYIGYPSSVWMLPAVAFICADIGLMLAVVTLAIRSRKGTGRGEPVGLFIFANILALYSVVLMFFYRSGQW